MSYSALFCTGLPSRLMKVSWFCKIWDYRFLWVHHISLLWLQYKTTVSFESKTFHIFRTTLLTYQVIHLSLAAAMWICHNQCINLWDSHCLHGEGKRERERCASSTFLHNAYVRGFMVDDACFCNVLDHFTSTGKLNDYSNYCIGGLYN